MNNLTNSNDNPKIAIVCDWLVGIGGSERVIHQLHTMFPDATIYTSQYNPKKIDWFTNADIRTTWVQKLPHSLKKFLPVLRAWSFSKLNLSNYDIVISAGGAEAKFVKTGSKTNHIFYCYAPTHYYWSRYDEYIKNPGFGIFNWLARFGLKLLVHPMRKWDYRAAQRPNQVIAISTHIQKEIKKYYNRDSIVIHPPVSIERFQHPDKLDSLKIAHPQPESVRATTVLSKEVLPIDTVKSRQGFIVAGRQTHYKRFDLAVLACTKLNLPLQVIGSGPEHTNLQKIAGPTIKFITNVSDQAMSTYMQSAQAFLFPGLDDFGITPVEALASGTPVIAYQAGGALDYVVPGQTGQFFTQQTPESLIIAIQKFQTTKYSESVCRAKAAEFSTSNFQQKFLKYTLNWT